MSDSALEGLGRGRNSEDRKITKQFTFIMLSVMLTMFGGRVSTCEMQKQSNAMQVTYARKWAAMEYQSRYNSNGGT